MVNDDTISRSEAIRNLMLQPKLTRSVVRRVLAQTKSVEIDENFRIKGKWELHNNGNGTCNVCNRTTMYVWDFDNSLNFCPHCGSDMR